MAVLASTGAHLLQRDAGPVPGWAREHAVVRVSATLSSDPQPLPAGRFGTTPRAALRVGTVSFVARGRRVASRLPVLVLAGQGWTGLHVGQRVVLLGRLAPAQRGDDVAAVVTALGPPAEVRPGAWPWRAADRVRAGLRAACVGLPADAGGLLPSLVVGDTSGLPDALRQDLRRSGLTHLTAVSGANVAIVVAGMLWLARLAGAGRRSRLVLAGLAVAGFVVLARPQPSVLRAAAMAAVALAGLGAGRRSRGGPALSAATIALLVIDPWLARNAGFALSVSATAGLLWLVPPWAARLERRLPRPLALAVAAPAAAQAACGPVLILLTPSVSLASIPANLLAEPAVAPATLIGVAAAAMSLMSPCGAHLAAMLGALATGWIAQVAHRLAGLPLACLPWLPGFPGALLLAVLTAVLVLVTSRAPRTRPPPATRPPRTSTAARGLPLRFGPVRFTALLGALALSLAALGWSLAPRLPLPARWRSSHPAWAAAMCDVGQGDALVLRSGRDRAVLVDAGPAPDPVDRCLHEVGVQHLDTVLLTHFHADHVLGLPGVLRGRDTGQLVVSPLQAPAGDVRAVLGWAGRSRVPVRVGQLGMAGSSGAGGWRVRWWVVGAGSPGAAAGSGPRTEPDEDSSANDGSLVTVLQVDGPAGSLRVLDLGDLDAEGQQRLAAGLATSLQRAGGPVQVVKVAHHGSRDQDARLYRMLGARLGLVGVGAGNDYGHPSPATVRMLAGLGIVVARTDTNGTVLLQPVSAGLQVLGLSG